VFYHLNVNLFEVKKMADVSPSGLSEAQALEFHEQFKKTYVVFLGLAAVVHVLVYLWKPWF